MTRKAPWENYVVMRTVFLINPKRMSYLLRSCSIGKGISRRYRDQQKRLCKRTRNPICCPIHRVPYPRRDYLISPISLPAGVTQPSLELPEMIRPPMKASPWTLWRSAPDRLAPVLPPSNTFSPTLRCKQCEQTSFHVDFWIPIFRNPYI